MPAFQRSGAVPKTPSTLNVTSPRCQREIDALPTLNVGNNSFHTEASSIDELKDEDIASEELADFIDLTIDDDPVFVRSRKRRLNTAPLAPVLQHEKITIDGSFAIKRNKLFELDPERIPKSTIESHFMLVTAITENLWTHEVTIRGLPFTRSRTLMAKLPRKLNEIFAVYELEEDDSRAPEDQACIEVPIFALLRPRTLHLTNAPYPHHRYEAKAFHSREAVENEGTLVCRWKFYVHYRNSNNKRDRKGHHWSLERIRDHEVIRDEYRVPEEDLRENWRGQTIRGGSRIPEAQGSVAGFAAYKQQYTVFDSFCGAGGFSRGAERAGLYVEHAIDHWEKACGTYRLNFPNTNLFEMSIDELMLASKDTQMRTDILHLSPPCQTWSPAHTVAGANDEANIASLFACRSLVEKALSKINATSTYHNPEEEVKDTLPAGSVVSDPDQILRRCVTCSGGQNMHWSNKRAYTVREFASLQGFPVWHQFADAPKSALKKQIGNAFPACVVRPLCEHLKKHLLVEDGLAPAQEMRSSIGGRELVFVSEGPRREDPSAALSPGVPDPRRSRNDAIMLDDDVVLNDDLQISIKYDHDYDVEMSDVSSAPATPNTPKTPVTPETPYTWRSRSRSRTMSLRGTPEPRSTGGSKDMPIVFDD
ncbi:C-5 cytosine-specific DNA methylase [Colletotrichum higginsianum]|nr:C-5 cytosine-specific DNA methylase [Colletotrichum higginsianum]